MAKYPGKILPKAKNIKGIAMRMGASWHCKMSCSNEYVGAKKVFFNLTKRMIKSKKDKDISQPKKLPLIVYLV